MRRRTDRDVAAFETHASRCEAGRLGTLHWDIADRTADLGLAVDATPRRVLDVGCGTGYLLRKLATRAPEAKMLVGVDPAARMIRIAQLMTDDERLRFSVGRAEELPFSDARSDLVVTTTSFDHWRISRLALLSVHGCWRQAADSCLPTCSRGCCCRRFSSATGERREPREEQTGCSSRPGWTTRGGTVPTRSSFRRLPRRARAWAADSCCDVAPRGSRRARRDCEAGSGRRARRARRAGAVGRARPYSATEQRPARPGR